MKPPTPNPGDTGGSHFICEWNCLISPKIVAKIYPNKLYLGYICFKCFVSSCGQYTMDVLKIFKKYKKIAQENILTEAKPFP